MLTSKNRLCIDIGNNKIKIIEAVVSKNGINIKKAAILETPDNSFNDGDITNLISMKDEIERGLKENKIKCKNAIFTVNSTNIIMRELTIPVTKEENIRGIISSVLTQAIKKDILADNPQFVITIDDVANIPENDRANRRLPDVKFSATFSGAIQKVEVEGNITI